MNKTERKTILDTVYDRAEIHGYYCLTNNAEAKTSAHICMEIECLAQNLGIPYDEINEYAKEGYAAGEQRAKREKQASAQKLYRDLETGNTITRAELERVFETLRSESPEEYDYSFSRYIMECTGKNGTLEEITINQK